MEIKKNTLYMTSIVLIIVIGGFFFLRGDSSTNNNVIYNDGQDLKVETQKVVLSQEDLNYKDVTVETSKPISLSADNSVSGCLRSVVFNVNGKKYSKYLRTPEDTLELPALSKGTYTFSCSMGMGYGKIIVK